MFICLQADYTRHLDELSKDVEWTLLRILQALYVNDGEKQQTAIGLRCMRMLEKFIAVFRDGECPSHISLFFARFTTVRADTLLSTRLIHLHQQILNRWSRFRVDFNKS